MAKTKINGAFRFHNVGQGLFYSGILNVKDNKKHYIFTFVYDCGAFASSTLEKEINDFTALLPKGTKKNHRLNLLVLSHLHEDHINGLQYLLNDVEIDTLVMPFNKELNELAKICSTNYEDTFVQNFYDNLIMRDDDGLAEWFVSINIKRVFFIDFDVEDDELNQNDEPFFIPLDDDINTTITRIQHKKKSFIMLYANYWKFHIQSLKFDKEFIKKYSQIVDSFIEEKNSTLKEILKEKNLLAKLREKLNDSIKNFHLNYNKTSLLMFHYPLNFCKSLSFVSNQQQPQVCPFNHFFWKNYPYHTRNITVLPGDVFMKKTDVNNLLKNFLDDEEFLGRCFVLQYPHHGSHCGENLRFSKFLNANFYVIPYGLCNKYIHPDYEVIDDLCESGVVIFVNEQEYFNYYILTEYN